MEDLDYVVTIRVSIAGALIYAAVFGGVVVLAVIGVACLLGAG